MSTPRQVPTPRWERPNPLGYAHGAKEAQFVAAPLLAAASLGLAGVVAGANNDVFLLPGPTLLVLVVSAMTLIFSIQLGYHARKFLYSRQDVLDWYPEGTADQAERFAALREQQGNDFVTWRRFNNGANRCFNGGTVLLGFGIAAALAPPDGSKQGIWRWWAAGLVLVATLGEIVWLVILERRVNERAAHGIN
ncbi:hypothetical protein [Streptomyces sp. NPDC002758]